MRWGWRIINFRSLTAGASTPQILKPARPVRHQPNGQGLAGLAPSLVYSRWVLGDPRLLARIVLNGKVQENLTMPPWKAAFDDEAIAGMLTFMRRSWEHDADPVPTAIVTAARAEVGTRETPWTDPELDGLARMLRPIRRF